MTQKFCIKFGNETYPIENEEIAKVMRAMETKSIVVLKCGIMHGAFIRGIVRDMHAERGWYYGYRPTGADGITPKSYAIELPQTVGKLLEQRKTIIPIAKKTGKE